MHKPLNDQQLRLLLSTPYDNMVKVFPGLGRPFLSAERQRAKQKFSAELEAAKQPDPLTDEQLKILMKTPQDDWPRIFQGYFRSFLRSERHRALRMFPPERKIVTDAVAPESAGIEPLTDEQLKILLETKVDDEPLIFKGFPRVFLRAERIRARAKFPPETMIDLDAKKKLETSRLREAELKYQAATNEAERLRKALEQAQNFPMADARDMRIDGKPGEREATAIAMASDWHVEERVTFEQTNGLNEHNLEIADERARWFFKNTAKLVHKEAKHVAIKNLILWVGGDMISGSIHDDLAEANILGPMDAIAFAQDTITGGIEQLLGDLPGVNLTVVFSSGNHGRSTKEQRWATEHENSLEFLMAHSIARFFKGNPRVRFVRDRSLLTYIDVHGKTLRFLHGHSVNYNGGSGGITIPINKAIGRWDKGHRAHYTMMGHFHQLIYGPDFVVNGSALGYTAYSSAIKADYEPPQQAFCLIDSKYGMTSRLPIILEAA